MNKLFKKIIRFEDKLWAVDLSNVDDWRVEIIEADGTRRDATTDDGSFFEVLRDGMVVGEDVLDQSPPSDALADAETEIVFLPTDKQHPDHTS